MFKAASRRITNAEIRNRFWIVQQPTDNQGRGGTVGRWDGGTVGEFRTDPDLLAQLAIKEGLSSHCITQAKASASYR